MNPNNYLDPKNPPFKEDDSDDDEGFLSKTGEFISSVFKSAINAINPFKSENGHPNKLNQINQGLNGNEQIHLRNNFDEDLNVNFQNISNNVQNRFPQGLVPNERERKNENDNLINSERESRFVCRTPKTKRNYLTCLFENKYNFDYLCPNEKVQCKIYKECLLQKEKELQNYARVIEVTNKMFNNLCKNNEKLSNYIKEKEEKIEEYRKEIIEIKSKIKNLQNVQNNDINNNNMINNKNDLVIKKETNFFIGKKKDKASFASQIISEDEESIQNHNLKISTFIDELLDEEVTNSLKGNNNNNYFEQENNLNNEYFPCNTFIKVNLPNICGDNFFFKK